MASGCIIDQCWVCGELVWEDEDMIFLSEDEVAHRDCEAERGKGKYDLKLLKNMMKQCMEEIQRLEEMVREN